jgi:hypothetical protein
MAVRMGVELERNNYVIWSSETKLVQSLLPLTARRFVPHDTKPDFHPAFLAVERRTPQPEELGVCCSLFAQETR